MLHGIYIYICIFLFVSSNMIKQKAWTLRCACWKRRCSETQLPNKLLWQLLIIFRPDFRFHCCPYWKLARRCQSHWIYVHLFGTSCSLAALVCLRAIIASYFFVGRREWHHCHFIGPLQQALACHKLCFRTWNLVNLVASSFLTVGWSCDSQESRHSSWPLKRNF